MIVGNFQGGASPGSLPLTLNPWLLLKYVYMWRLKPPQCMYSWCITVIYAYAFIFIRRKSQCDSMWQWYVNRNENRQVCSIRGYCIETTEGWNERKPSVWRDQSLCNNQLTNDLLTEINFSWGFIMCNILNSNYIIKSGYMNRVYY